MTDETKTAAREALMTVIARNCDYRSGDIADAILASPALDAIVAERVAALAGDEALMRRWHALSNPGDPADPSWDWRRASNKADALAAALTERTAER